MRILCTAPGEFTGDDLEIGHYYFVEKDDSGTLQQNSLFHALLDVYFTSGCYSYPVSTKADLKIAVKKSLGEGFERIVYFIPTGKGPVKGEAKTMEEVPENVMIGADGKDMVYGELKSWSDYTKAQRTKMLQNLIAEMKLSGVNSKKFEEILKGLEGKQ